MLERACHISLTEKTLNSPKRWGFLAFYKCLLSWVSFGLFLGLLTHTLLAAPQITIQNKTFEIELAKTPIERARGLMFRDQLPTSNGMLFVFDKPQSLVFWMKNTWIPLDMIWIDDDLKIADISHNASPNSTALVQPKTQAQYVLEINGGLAQKYGFKVGDSVTGTPNQIWYNN